MAEGTTVSLKLLIQATNRASKQVEELKSQLNQVAQEAVKLGQESKKAASGGQQAMGGFASSMETFHTKMKAATEATKGLGTAAATLLGIATSISGAIFFPVKSSVDFERQLSKVVAVTTDADKMFGQLQRTASELGRTTEFTAKQAAEGMVYLGMAGLDAREVIEGIAPSLNLAIAAAVDVGTAADIATNILSAMRLPVEELTTATDILAATTANANTNLIELAEGMKYAGPLAAAAGVSLEEVSSIMGALANNGIKGSMAGTAVRGMLRALTAPTENASKALDKLGIRISLNADGSLDLINALEQLGKAQMNSADATAIFGRFAAAGALAVTANIKGLKELIAVNESSAGAARKMADTMKDNVKGAFIQMTSALDGFKRAMAEPLLSTIRAALETMRDMLTWLTELAEEYPVVTKLIGLMAIAAAALSATLGVLALAIWSVTNALTVLSGTGVTAVLRTIAANVFSLTGLFGLLKGAVTSLWAVISAHPIGALVTGIGLLLVGLLEWSGRTEKLVREKQRLGAEISKITNSFTKQKSKLDELEKGSDAYVAVAKNMREELLQAAKNTEELAAEAYAAASSINEFTGEVEKGGEAINNFIKASQELQLQTTAQEMDALIQRFRELIGDTDFLTQSMMGLKKAWDYFWTAVRGGDLSEVSKKMQRETKAIMQQIEATAKSFIRMNETFGKLDPESTFAEVDFFLREISLQSETASRAYKKAFVDMKYAAQETAETQKKIEELTLDQLTAEVEKGVVEVLKLDQAWKDSRDSAVRAIEIWKTAGGKANLQAATKAYEAQVEAQKKRTEEIAQAEAKIRGLRERYRGEDKKWYDEATRLNERQVNLEYKSKEAGEIKQAQIEAEYARRKQEHLEIVLKYGIDASVKELNVVKETAEEKVKADERVKESAEDLSDARIKLANQQKKAIEAIERKAEDTRISLMDEGPAKFKLQQEAEIQALKDAAADKLIQEDKLANAIKAIKEKYAKQSLDWQRELDTQREEVALAAAERLAERELSLNEANFQKREITAKQFADNQFNIQKDLITKQIAEIDRQLSGATSPEVIVKLIADKTELEEALAELGRQRPTVERQAELEAQAMQLSMQEQLMQGELGLMDQSVGGLEDYYAKKLELQKITNAQELIAMEQQGAKSVEIAQRTAQQELEVRRQQAEQEKAITIAKLQWAEETATMMGDIFGDLYSASGEKTKAWFYLEKAAAIARIIISTQVAAMKAYEQTGIWGTIHAALIYMKGVAAISKVGAQQIATGGEVQGKSPHKKADNIPAWLTAEEWVHPVDAVKYYGKRVMYGMQKMLYPKELFEGFRMPVPVYASGRRFAAGGSLSASAAKEYEQKRTVQEAPTSQQPQPITIVNVTDPAELDRYLSTSDGQNAMLNVLSSRAETVKRILK